MASARGRKWGTVMKPCHPGFPIGLPPEPDDETIWLDGKHVWTRNDLEADAYSLEENNWFITGSNHPYTWEEVLRETDVSKWVQLIPAGETGRNG